MKLDLFSIFENKNSSIFWMLGNWFSWSFAPKWSKRI